VVRTCPRNVYPGEGAPHPLQVVAFFLVLLVGAAVVVAVWFAADRSGRERRPERRSEEEALEILRRRYARGEITREEFNQMREDILS